MISIEKEMRVRLLLHLGLSGRQIAKKVKVARQTIKLIKKSPTIRPRKKSRHSKPLPKLKVPRRCPTCGGKVYTWPCLSCNPETGA